MAAPDPFGPAQLFNAQAYLGPGLTPVAITASGSDLALKPRFIHVGGAAGSVTYVANGVTITEAVSYTHLTLPTN